MHIRQRRVLTPPALRHTPRVAAFFDFIVNEIDTLRPIITGRRSGPEVRATISA